MADVEVYDATEDLRRAWWVLLVMGLLSLGFGGLLIFWPGQTLTVVTTIVGLFMIVAGVARFFVGVFDGDREHRLLLVVLGIVGVVIGVIIMRNPESTIRLIVLLTALFWLVSGMVDLFRGLTNARLPDRSLRILFGAMSAIFGVIILVWPDITVGVFAVLTGIYVVFFGILEILAAFQLKNA
jgi:uncharacterized membrane protein HdeD (DUF308 family)